MIGTIIEVRRSDRFCWIRGRNDQKYFGSFKDFLLKLSHTCQIVENCEVEFEVARNSRDVRRHDSAVNVTLLGPMAGFATNQVELILEVWNGEYGFARTRNCGCNNVFIHITNFLTDERFLTSEFLKVGSRIVADLEHIPDKRNARAVQIELYQPEGFDASVLPVV